MNWNTLYTIGFMFIVISIFFITTILILNRISYPFKTCEGQEDNYTINFGKNMTCGEVRAINTSIASNDKVSFFGLVLFVGFGGVILTLILRVILPLFEKKKLPNNDNKSI